jgi:hypothetical protein
MKPFTGGFPVFRPGKGDVAMIVTCIAVFFITFGLLMERRSKAPSPEENSASMVTARREAIERPQAWVIPRQADPSTSRMVRPLAQATAAAPRVSMAATGSDASGGELPVDISFRRGRGNDGYLEGSVFNKSSDDLQVEVNFYNPQTKRASKAELTVPANHASSFGRDDGLEIEGGEQVTVKSPSYTEKHLEVR